MTPTRPRAVYRSYFDGGKRAGQVRRLHVIRETATPSLASGESTLCGQSAYPVTHSNPVVLCPLPDRPPEGLTWCPKCIGHLAEVLGLLDEVAASVAAYDPSLTGLCEERWWASVQEQREMRRKAMEGQR